MSEVTGSLQVLERECVEASLGLLCSFLYPPCGEQVLLDSLQERLLLNTTDAAARSAQQQQSYDLQIVYDWLSAVAATSRRPPFASSVCRQAARHLLDVCPGIELRLPWLYPEVPCKNLEYSGHYCPINSLLEPSVFTETHTTMIVTRLFDEGLAFVGKAGNNSQAGGGDDEVGVEGLPGSGFVIPCSPAHAVTNDARLASICKWPLVFPMAKTGSSVEGNIMGSVRSAMQLASLVLLFCFYI